MDIQFWIGFWTLLFSGAFSLVSILGSQDGDRRTREHLLIERGPSLKIDRGELKNLPAYARHRKGKVPITSLEEVWEWCEGNLSRRPHFLRNSAGTPFAVFQNENDAFAFKMRWL